MIQKAFDNCIDKIQVAFSKEKFEKNISKTILNKVTEEHRNALDGLEVKFDTNE